MSVDLYAIFSVRNYASSEAWYARFFGMEPSFRATDTECVWELAENRSFVIEQLPEHAGHSIITVFVDDFDTRIAEISSRGIEPHELLTYRNGVRKALYRDPDGNEFGYGGAPTQ